MQTKQTAQDTINNVKRKSAALTAEEKKELKKYVNGFTSLTEAAESLAVSRQTLDRVLLVGSGKPENIELIREKLKSAA